MQMMRISRRSSKGRQGQHQQYRHDEEQRKRIYFDYNQHEAAIKAWKAHLVWTVLQEEAKQAALDKL